MRRGLREIALRGCGAIGLLAGFVWGFEHPVRPTCTTGGAPGGALNRCTNHSITVIVTHWGLALGGGLVIGGMIGVAIALSIGVEKT